MLLVARLSLFRFRVCCGWLLITLQVYFLFAFFLLVLFAVDFFVWFIFKIIFLYTANLTYTSFSSSLLLKFSPARMIIPKSLKKTYIIQCPFLYNMKDINDVYSLSCTNISFTGHNFGISSSGNHYAIIFV